MSLKQYIQQENSWQIYFKMNLNWTVFTVLISILIENGLAQPSLRGSDLTAQLKGSFYKVKTKSEKGIGKRDSVFETNETTIFGGRTIEIDLIQENGMSKAFKLQLVPNHFLVSLKTNDSSLRSKRSSFFAGIVQGYPNSSIRLNILDSDGNFETTNDISFEGHIDLGTEAANDIYYFELLEDDSGKLIQISYRDADVIQKENQHDCMVLNSTAQTQSDNDLVLHGHSATNSRRNPFNPEIVRVGPLKSKSRLERILDKRQSSSSNSVDCPMAIFADYSFYEMFGNDTLDYMLSIMNEVQAIYLEKEDTGLPIIYQYVIQNSSSPSGLGFSRTSDPEEWLVTFRNAVDNSLFPDYDKNSICLNFLFSSKSFGSTLGVAYWSFNDQVGICANSGYNTGLATCNLQEYRMIRRNFVQTIIHEIGHSFGAPHDTDHYYFSDFNIDTNICNMNDNRFIMYPYTTVQDSAFDFSACSTASFELKKSRVSCLVPRDTIAAVYDTFGYQDSIYGGSQNFDQCNMMSEVLKIRLRNRGYSLTGELYNCPYRVSNEYCTLTCTDKYVSQCFQFPGSFYSEGTICGVNYPNPDICSNGNCIADTRSDVCDRSQACCKPTGIVQPSTHWCKMYNTNVISACRPIVDYCDPDHIGDDNDCPITIRPPGTPCNCKDVNDLSTCSDENVCGDGDSFGLCVTQEDFNSGSSSNLNDQTLCSSNSTCSSQNEVCVVAANTKICKDLDEPSCRYICGNVNFDYQFSNGSSWGCHCGQNCTQSNSCCDDFFNYCNATSVDMSWKFIFPNSNNDDQDDNESEKSAVNVGLAVGLSLGSLAIIAIAVAYNYRHHYTKQSDPLKKEIFPENPEIVKSFEL